MSRQLTLKNALRAVQTSDDGLYAVLLEHGSMELGYYRPSELDQQKPHEQDEIYIVQTGSGVFIRDDQEIRFGRGDALFVRAGVEHRFTDFSDDFGAWVIFYGPPGGE